MRKFTLEYVQNYFREQGCELIEKKYKNSTTKVEYKCNCGTTSTISFNEFKKGKRCWTCGVKKRANNRKHTYEYVKSFFKNNRCNLLETEYAKSNVKMRYKCSCGNISKITFNNFKSGKRCNKCGTKRASERTKHTFQYVSDFFKNNECELLEDEYINSGTKMKYRCNCGNIDKIKFNHFKEGHRCSSCGGTKKLTFEFVRQYFKDKGCELLEMRYINNQTKMKYRCICGDASKITFGHFQQGKRCHKCGIEKNSGKNNHNYNPQLTDEERGIRRNYPEYTKWRKEVYVRDDYVCQKCKQRGYTLNAHHILNYSNNKSLRTSRDNGITLCKKCHVGFHKKYGRYDNTQQQLDEYL